MIGWIIAGIYITGYVLAARRIAWLIRNDDDQGAVWEARAMGCIVGLVWPLLVLGMLVTGRLPRTDQEIRALLRQRDQRIAELERELDLPPSTETAP